MTEKMIRDAYCRIRTIDQTIPDDVLDFMKDAALEKLHKYAVIESVCSCSKGKGIDYDEDGKAYCIDCGNYLEQIFFTNQ